MEPEPDPEPANEQPADSPGEAPLQIDEGIETPAKSSEMESQSEPEQGQTAPPVPTSPPDAGPGPDQVPAPAEQANKNNDQPKSTPVQRNKIAQNLKKTLETRRSQSRTVSEVEDGAALCEADAVPITKLKAEVSSLKHELELEKRNHMKAMEAEKKRLQIAIADLQREKDQALLKATETLKRSMRRRYET